MEEKTAYLRDLIPAQIDNAQPSAWKEIENGRFQPQRIKGSCLGRELG